MNKYLRVLLATLLVINGMPLSVSAFSLTTLTEPQARDLRLFRSWLDEPVEEEYRHLPLEREDAPKAAPFQTAVVYQNTANVSTEADGGIVKTGGGSAFNGGGISTVQITSADLPATLDWSVITAGVGGFPGYAWVGIGSNADYSSDPELSFRTDSTSAFATLREDGNYRGDCAVGAGVFSMTLTDNGAGGATAEAFCNGVEIGGGTTFTIPLPTRFDVNLNDVGAGLVSASMTLTTGGGGPGGPVITVCDAGCDHTTLQPAVNSAEITTGAVTILLQEGKPFTQDLRIGPKVDASTTNTITIRTGVSPTGTIYDVSRYLADDIRVCPSNFSADVGRVSEYICSTKPGSYDVATRFAKIIPSTNNAYGITCDDTGSGTPCAHYNFRWLEFIGNTYGGNALIGIQNFTLPADTGTVAMMPHHFIFDQVVVRGLEGIGQLRGWWIAGNNITIKNSHADVRSLREGQVIGSTSSKGPITIVNNYLSGGGETLLFGGGASIPGPRFTVLASPAPTTTVMTLDRAPEDVYVGKTLVFRQRANTVTSITTGANPTITTGTTHNWIPGETVEFDGVDGCLNPSNSTYGNINSHRAAEIISVSGNTAVLEWNCDTAATTGTVWVRSAADVTNVTGNQITVTPALPHPVTSGMIVESSIVTENMTIRNNIFTRPLTDLDGIVPAPTGVTATAGGGGTLAAGTHSYLVIAYRTVAQTDVAHGRRSTVAQATTGASGSVQVSWTPPAGAVTYYRVFRTSGTAVYWQTTNTTITDTGSGQTGGGSPPTSGGGGFPAANYETWFVKNTLELKQAKDVVIEGNIIENSWLDGQVGPCVVFTGTPQLAEADSSKITNVVFRDNVVRNCGQYMQVQGMDAMFYESGRDGPFTIDNNLFYNSGPPYGNGIVSALSMMGNSGTERFTPNRAPNGITMTHNTVHGFGVNGSDGFSRVLSFDYWHGTLRSGATNQESNSPNTVIRDNIFYGGTYGIASFTGGGQAIGRLGLWPAGPLGTGSSINTNVLVNGGACGSYTATTTNMMCVVQATFEANAFTDTTSIAGFKVKSTSSYFAGAASDATDGTSMGANIDAIEAEMVITLSGNNSGQAPALNINTTTLPDGTQGVAYSQPLDISGGTLPYSCSLTAGAFPTGVSLTGSGSCTISGTPSVNGIFSVTIQVMDGLGVTDSQVLSLTINAAGGLTITTTTLPNPVVGMAYSQAMAATGGTGPYTWSRTGSTMIAGLTFGTDGVLSGTPTIATAVPRTYNITVTDSLGVQDSQSITLSSVRAVVRAARYNWTWGAHFQQSAAPTTTEQVRPGDLWSDIDDGSLYRATCTVTGLFCSSALTWNAFTGTGEANTTSNAGAGLGLALAKSGVDLPFKSLVEGLGIDITSQADTLTIATTGAPAVQTIALWAGPSQTMTPAVTPTNALNEFPSERSARVKLDAENSTQCALNVSLVQGSSVAGNTLVLQYWDGSAWQSAGCTVLIDVAGPTIIEGTFSSLAAGARVQDRIYRARIATGDGTDTVQIGTVYIRLR